MAEVAEAPAVSGTQFIKDAFSQAFGPDAVRSAGEPVNKTYNSEVPAKSLADIELEKQEAQTVQTPKSEEKQQEETPKAEENAEKAEETLEGEEIAEPVQLDEKGRYRWGELKKENKNQKAAIAELQKKLQEHEQAVTLSKQTEEQLSSLQRRMEEANRDLFTVRIKKTPEWKEAVGDPFNKVADSLDVMAKMANLDGEGLFNAVQAIANKGDYAPLKAMLENVDADLAHDI